MKVKRVPASIVVLRVSARKYRLARQTSDGSGFSHFNLQGWGLTGIRQYEFISEPLTHQELHEELAQISEQSMIEEYTQSY